MPAVDLRRFLATLVGGEGVRTEPELKVAQRGAGANMSVDVAAGYGLIKDDHTGGDGFYFHRLEALTNVAIATSHGSLPRIDRVGVRVRDQSLGDAASDLLVQALTGTPTSGATLSNLNGAPAIPGSWLLLGNILVPAASSSVTTANIDTAVRPVLTGRRATGAYSGGQLNFSSNVTNIVSVSMACCGERPLAVQVWGGAYSNATGATQEPYWIIYVNGVQATSAVQSHDGVSGVPNATTVRTLPVTFLVPASAVPAGVNSIQLRAGVGDGSGSSYFVGNTGAGAINVVVQEL